jgi:hypothetical protein
MIPMMNTYDTIRANLRFNKFEVGELLFVEYKCPIEQAAAGKYSALGSSIELTNYFAVVRDHFMSRPLRIQFSGAVYHVMNRGAARHPTFIDDRDCQVFLDTVAEAYRLWGSEVFAYSLMGNHYLCGAPHNQCYVKFRIM